MSLNSRILQRFKSGMFVETGSYIGLGIIAAIDVGFPQIRSIELSERYFDICTERFKKNSNIKIFQGDSSLILFDVIKDIKEKITFWLDGHYSGGNTAMGQQSSPLLLELEQIKRHDIKDHIILINDLRCWSKDNPEIGFGEEEIKEKLYEINSNYKILHEDGVHDEHVFKDDILVAII